MKRIFILVLASCLSTYITAQNTSNDYTVVREDLDNMFENLDKTKVPTGILLDYAVDRVDFSNYEGTLNDNNFVDLATYQDILYSLASAGVIYNPIGRVDNIIKTFTSGTSYIDISFTAFKYNFIRENALVDNLISYNESTGKVSDKYIGDIWQNPYSEKTIFAFCTNNTNTNFLSTIFRFINPFKFTNLNISNIYFDAGDNRGYRPIQNSSIIIAQYLTPGTKEVKLKIITSDGNQYEAHSSINIGVLVGENNARASNDHSDPDNCDTLSTTWSPSVDEGGYNTQVSALISYYYKTGESSITKPFIVVEGFDPWILNYLTSKLPDEDVPLGFTNHSNFYESYWSEFNLQNEYDLIYIDWGDSLADIRANAKLFRLIINHINTLKAQSGCYEKNIIMGQSMGGLIARYALRKMEFDAEDHKTNTYISHDSPHLGANVPLGALYFAQQAISLVSNFDGLIDIFDLFSNNLLHSTIERFCSVLNGESVKQMLYNYAKAYCMIDNTTHIGWQQELSVLGFPTKTENLAIVNGGQGAWNLFNNSHLLYAEGYVKSSILTSFLLHGLLFIFSGNPKLEIKAEVRPYSSNNAGQYISKLTGTYTKEFFWLYPKQYTIFHSAVNGPSSSLYYDDFLGSKFHLSDSNSIAYGHESGILGEYFLDVNICNDIMFIPTASALAIEYDGTPNVSHYTKDYFNHPPTPETETPFNAYFIYPQATTHIHIDNIAYNWISRQLNAKIDGPDTLMSSSARYTASGFTNPVQWSSSNNTIAVIDNNGSLTATGNGMVTISAESYNNGELIRKTKNIMIGFPDIAITYNFSPGTGHMFAISTPDSKDSGKLQEIVDAGYLKYEWSILCDENDLITTISTKPSISHQPKNDETVTVCVRLIDNNGNKGATYSRTVNLKNPFLTNYQFVEIDQYGIVKFIRSNGYETGAPSEDFTLSFRNIIYTEYDNALSLAQKYLKGNNCYLAHIDRGNVVYLNGSKMGLQLKWTFPLFNNLWFTNALNDVIDNATSNRLDSGELTDLGLFICNHEKEFMQIIPFAIIYNPL